MPLSKEPYRTPSYCKQKGKERRNKERRGGTKEIIARNKGNTNWYPTPVLLPGKSHGQRSLVGCSPWDR